MKTLILIVLFSLPTLIFGQVNHFANSTSEWNVVREYPNPSPIDPFFIESRTKIYGFNGDTIVNGIQWGKMFSTFDSAFLNNLNFLGFVRSENGYIFRTTLFNSIDTLYNFNLSIGDSVFFNIPNKQQFIPVIQKDSIAINGLFYDRFEFAEPVGVNSFTVFGEVWIEGIGSVHGPLFPLNPQEFSSEITDKLQLACTRVSSLQYWSHPLYNQCIINNVLKIEDHQLNSINIFPNPFSDMLVVDLGNHENAQITLFNSLGQRIIQLNNEANLVELDLSYLDSGLYIMEVRQSEKVETIKLIKN